MPSPFLLSQNKHLALADQENSTHCYINKSQVAGTLSHNEKEISESTVSSDDGLFTSKPQTDENCDSISNTKYYQIGT